MNLYRPIPSNPHDWFTDEQIAESRRYNRGRQWISWTDTFLMFATIVVVIATRGIERVSSAVGATNWVAQLAIGIALVVVGGSIASLPVDLSKHAYERRWAFTDQSDREWFVDHLKGIAVALSVYLALFTPVVALIRSTELWWLWGWLFFVAFTIVLSAVYPLLVMPLFNTFTPIDDESLEDRVQRLGREAGIPISRVLTMDASKQTRRDNAFFSGFGRLRRVVLYDNLLKQSPREVDAVIAHELSHWRRRHMLKSIALASVVSLALFVALKALSAWSDLLDLVGADGFGDPTALPLVMTLFGIGSSALGLLTSWQTRAQERQADFDSLEFTRDAKTFLDTHLGLALRNLAELEPSWWHRVRATHPPAAERLALGKWWQAQRLVTVLFTDIEESTLIIERLGDEGWFSIRRDHDEIVRGKVAEHRGQEIDAAGDGFLVVFEDAGEALLCAVEVQRDLEDHNRTNPEARIRVRMGLHSGEVIRKDKAVFGRAVNLAARVASQAAGGEILVSDAVKTALEGAGRFTFTDERAVELKGLSGQHLLHRVDWALSSAR